MPRSTATFATIAASALLAATAATAQPVDTSPCTTLVVDKTAENGFSIGAGQTSFEACSLGDVPETSGAFHCLWGDGYHTTKFTGNWTALQSLPTVQFSYAYRLNAGGEPGAALDPELHPGEIPSAAIFPQTTLSREDDYEGLSLIFNRRLANRWLLRGHVSSIWSCAEWSAPAQDRFVAVDRSGTTPVRPCRVRSDGAGPWEDCNAQDPLLRALGFGTRVAPIAGHGTTDQVVPPFAGPFTGSIQVYYTGTKLPVEPPPGDNTFRFLVEHDAPNPIVAHVHDGYPGVNGPILFTFPDPRTPIDVSGIVLTAEQIEALGANRLYFDVHNAAHPGGAIRGQLIPAQPGIFADGFESGDTSAWSSTVP